MSQGDQNYNHTTCHCHSCTQSRISPIERDFGRVVYKADPTFEALTTELVLAEYNEFIKQKGDK